MARLLLIILGCALVTYVPRFLPMYILTRIKIPKVVVVWLRYVPAAVLSALIAPGITTAEGSFYLSLSNSYLLASIPVFIVAWRTKNMLLTVCAGMAAVLVL